MSIEGLVDGAKLRGRPTERSFDVVVIGSGPAGAVVALDCQRAGARVAVVEEGPYVEPSDYPEDGFTAMARLYRDMGASVTLSSAPMPFLQGRAVGGTSVVNGAISWRLPSDVHAEWCRADPALEQALPFEQIDEMCARVEADLHIRPTERAISGRNNLLLEAGAVALGLENRPIRRNVRDCRGLGRCLQGCPEGHKTSMDRTYLPAAGQAGTVLFSSTRARRIIHQKGRATAVLARAAGGSRLLLKARRAVVLAASAVQSPGLLVRSGIWHGPVGRGFQCHPGVSMAGRFAEPVKIWSGATQGHEVIGLRREGIKFEALGYDKTIVATRLKSVGRTLGRDIAELAHQANWGAAIRSTARGRVLCGPHRSAVIYSPSRLDMERVRRGVAIMGEMMLAAGAEAVTPGVHGWHERVSCPMIMARFREEGPLDPTAYAMAVTHMFGTARMGSDPAGSVVRPDFRHHRLAGLYVADSSVFPSNTGVNPQTSIIALAALCARRIVS